MIDETSTMHTDSFQVMVDMFGKNGTDPKDVGLNNQGAIDGIEYAKNLVR